MTGEELLELNKKIERGYELFCSSYVGCARGNCPYKRVENCKEDFIKDIKDIDEFIKDNKLDLVEA